MTEGKISILRETTATVYENYEAAPFNKLRTN